MDERTATPVEYSFCTPALLGVHHERFCALAGLMPHRGGVGLPLRRQHWAAGDQGHR